MVKVYETEVVPETTRNVCVDTKCDLCGKSAGFDAGEPANWSDKRFDVESCEVALTEGVRYPEDTTLDITSFDICPQCFKEKLVKWLEEQGATPSIKRIEY